MADITEDITKIYFRKCQKCKLEKNVNDFPRNRFMKDGRGGYCKECKNKYFPSSLYRENWVRYYQEHKEKIKKYARNYYKNHKQRKRELDLRKMYNISPRDFDDLVDKQQGLCAICRQKKKLHIDHNHITGKVRGLLCNGCNRGIGFLGEDINLLNKAIKYLDGKFE